MHKTPEITRLIHENFWTVLSFALAQPAAFDLLDKQFKGHWKYLEKSIGEYAEVKADRWGKATFALCACRTIQRAGSLQVSTLWRWQA